MPRHRIHASNAARQKHYRDTHKAREVVYVPADQTPGAYVTSLQALLSTGQRFGTIYADPPWQYKDDPPMMDARKHYPTMPLEAICALPVQDLALSQAHLHCWVTKDFFSQAEQVFTAWGFEVRGEIVWVKTTKDGKTIQMGGGHYWRTSHESCVLGVRGNLTARQKNLRSVVLAPRGVHSAKPEIIRDRIEQLSPGPYLELFGRATVPGWTVWGNQNLPSNGRLFKDHIG